MPSPVPVLAAHGARCPEATCSYNPNPRQRCSLVRQQQPLARPTAISSMLQLAHSLTLSCCLIFCLLHYAFFSCLFHTSDRVGLTRYLFGSTLTPFYLVFDCVLILKKLLQIKTGLSNLSLLKLDFRLFCSRAPARHMVYRKLHAADSRDNVSSQKDTEHPLKLS